MIQTRQITASLTEIYVGGGKYLTENYPTNFHTFAQRKTLTANDDISNYREVSEAEKTAIEEADAKWTEPPKSFIDLWTAAGRYRRNGKTVNGSGYDPENAPDTLHSFYTGINGKVWLTYEEAVDIYTHYTPLKTSNAANMYADYPFKATLPVVPHPSGEAVSAYMMFRSAVNIEVAVLSIMATNCAFMFAGCHRLRKIDGYIFCPNADYYAMFLECYELEEVNLEWVSKSISFADSPKLKRSVFEFMLRYASSGITITVHPDVYAKLTGDTTNAAAAALTEEELAQWVAIMVTAGEKGIVFAAG